MEKVRLGIVVSKFNFDITYLMFQRALAHAKLLGAEVRVVVIASGAFEIPLAVSKLELRNHIHRQPMQTLLVELFKTLNI
jgi:6,7-dimethyl-8-ribityllumazine synthase